MSFKISKILQFPQPTLQYILQDECDIDPSRGLPLLGGILSDTHYVWHSKGPCLEIRNTKTGIKVGAWTFGCILKDSNTRIVCVEEIQRPNGMLSLLAVAIDCAISGGLICIFDVFGSKVIRAIQIEEKITSLHVVDSGCEVLNLPGPLRNFDGIISVGTEGGNVYLVDICRQICEEALHSVTVRDELCPCHLILLTIKDIPRVEYYKEKSVREGDHLAIHLNIVVNSSTHHFTLKGPKGDDRIFANREEVVTSALYYCSQLTSLLVGFNFGAFQLWDLTSLKLVYTSPVCEEHLPITHFALQEPADDPRAFCYIWASYSNMNLHQSGLPFAVMYSVCYESKEYHEGYGYLYQDFQSCSVRFQVELGPLGEHKNGSKVKGGLCIGLQPICKVPNNKNLYLHDVTGDILALCAISWTVWFSRTETQTYMLVFDLNQWYKEQMPDFTKWSNCSNYILKANISELITVASHKGMPLLDIKLNNKSLRQFTGVQRLEEHFCPNALSFDLWGLREKDVILLHNEGIQKALLSQIESAGPLCLIRPSDVYRQIVTLGLTPLFAEASSHVPVSTEMQREIILNVALEHQLLGWLCKCASEWANGSFSSAGCSLDFLISWAFHRAIVLKTHCDRYCTPLFDYSQLRLDNNTSILLNSCIRQINNLSAFYSYVLDNLSGFISNLELVVEQQTSLKMVSIYFEVLQWLVNVGLLPECHPSTYPRVDCADRVSAPYPVQELTEYYNKKRAQLQMLTKETFISSDSLLFIDNLVNNKCGAQLLQKQWQDDGGSGLYPPPSLQSLLRTYLIEGADIGHKHSLIIYVFLDLAMALDQNRYASVITHLIKFPAVFKVSSSIIKITQAFWQLDHGDFTTAMEQLLDPLVLGDDLQPWHHAIAMRALLLQNQYNFALLYMQVRKPPITDEKDMLTAISLFIANNMLDEAFYFKNQHRNNNEEKLLMHLFNECNKNDSLHVLLYRCLDTNEERAFFKYLRSVENLTADDLQVFYYLLRSRFVEAFDAHQNSRRKNPESQGLVGQRNTTRTDQIVRIFKTLLPDINKNLVDVVRKERINLWKEVARPTPLSVFVHNSKEQVHYKSTVIHAALAKAKHTFIDSPTTKRSREIVTEETPFLRTPKVSRMSSRHPTPVITPKVIEIDESGEELSPSPSKRLKLTPRALTSSPTRNHSISIHSRMLTPIVRRKTSLQKDETLLSNSSFNVCTPQSILKIRNLVRHGDTISDDTKVDEMIEDHDNLPKMEISPRKSSLGLLPRKSLPRALRRPHVKFDDSIRLSSSLSDQSIKPSLNNTLENLSADKSTLSSKDVSLMISSKNSSTSNTDEVFYSPNTSLNDSENKEEDNINAEQNVSQVSDAVEKVEFDKKISVTEDIRENSSLTQSPRARRSYKRSFADTLPVRQSPRITRHFIKESSKLESQVPSKSTLADSDNKEESQSSPTIEDSDLSEASTSKIEPPSIIQSPRLLQKVKGRKSLSRKVLEHNTFSKTLYSPSVIDLNKSVTRETSFAKIEKSVVTRKTLDTLEVTTQETKEEIKNVSSLANTSASSHHSTTNSTYKEKISEGLPETDTSIEDNLSFSSPNLPESLKMSDSLVEYIKSRTSKLEFEQTPTENSKIQLEASEVTENSEIPQEETQKDDSLKEDKLEAEPMEIYEDLSSGAEDIKEILMESRLPSDQYEVYAELSNCPENSFNELEENIFERSGTMQQETVQRHLEKRPSTAASFNSFYQRGSDSFYVPEAEKGFLGDHSKAEISILSAECEVSESEKGFLPSIQTTNQEDVIEIGSSSDEQDSSKGGNSDTSDSRSLEKSESDEDELNISYERNIHVEENSRSLVDSHDSRTTDNSVADEDVHNEARLIVIEHVEEINNFNEVGGEADSNSADWVNNEQESSDESSEHPADEEVVIAEDRQPDENKPEEIIEMELEQPLQQGEEAEIIIQANLPEIDASEIKQDYKELVPSSDGIPLEEKEEANEGEEVEENQDISQKNETVENKPGDSLIEIKEIPNGTNTQCVDNSRGSQLEDKASQHEHTDEKNVQPPSITEAPVTHKEKTTCEQSTNTTILFEKEETIKKVEEISDTTTDKTQENIAQEKSKVDQSANTTNFAPEESMRKSNDSIIEVERPNERKTYHRAKVVTEDQTMSSVSSDTTEGEVVKHEIVVKADVHIPTRRRTEEPLVKRLTRRSSTLFSKTAESDILENITDPDVSHSVLGYDVLDEDLPNTTCPTPNRKAYVTDILEDSTLGTTFNSDSVFTPGTGTRSRRSRSVTASPSRPSKSLRFSRDKTDELDQSSTSKDIQKKTRKLRRTRSASVDEVVASPRRSLRRSSVDEKSEDSAESQKLRIRGKTTSVSQLPVITEEEKDKHKPRARNKASSVENYTTTRRLTRRQASFIKGVETPSSVTAQDDSDTEKLVDVDAIDPITLLHKEPFQGPPDPDEEKIYEPSSPSNSTASSFNKPVRRASRSASMTSDSSAPPTTPKRKTRQHLRVDSPSPVGVKTRSRKQSETSSVTSEKSDPPSPAKRSKRRHSSKEPEETNSTASAPVLTRSTRSRANSTSSVKSDTLNSPKKKPRNRRLISAKSDLPEITEEKNSEAGGSNEKSTIKRHTKKKSS
ncbi:protein ELYS isoform X2 [Anoplophora glabripennis]|uniref:protein ELYS isoform X2 n=1 Tax=Anoplophora glabripennis TaxID=217634 RepID=UPI000874C37F|nr:protein ELYS isoform X2 [Anoplophora glabripennis]